MAYEVPHMEGQAFSWCWSEGLKVRPEGRLMAGGFQHTLAPREWISDPEDGFTELAWRALTHQPALAEFLQKHPHVVLSGLAMAEDNPIVLDVWVPHRWLTDLSINALLSEPLNWLRPAAFWQGYYLPGEILNLAEQAPWGLEIRTMEQGQGIQGRVAGHVLGRNPSNPKVVSSKKSTERKGQKAK